MVANLPYNVAVPVLLHLLARFGSWVHGLVMVQLEVADRLVAIPGAKAYGAPSAKLAWYARAGRAGTVPPTVFWPVPNVDSGLVRIRRREPPAAQVLQYACGRGHLSSGDFFKEPRRRPRTSRSPGCPFA